MSLFKDENPALGAQTTEKELSGFGAGSPVVNYYKPLTRSFVDLSFDAVKTPTGNLLGWLFVAPWKCQIVQAKVVMDVSATASQTLQLYTLPVASQPVTVAGTGSAQIFSVAQSLSSATLAAGVVATTPLTTTAASLIMNPGDLLGYVLSGVITGVTGGLCQVEIIQLG